MKRAVFLFAVLVCLAAAVPAQTGRVTLSIPSAETPGKPGKIGFRIQSSDSNRFKGTIPAGAPIDPASFEEVTFISP